MVGSCRKDLQWLMMAIKMADGGTGFLVCLPSRLLSELIPNKFSGQGTEVWFLKACVCLDCYIIDIYYCFWFLEFFVLKYVIGNYVYLVYTNVWRLGTGNVYYIFCKWWSRKRKVLKLFGPCSVISPQSFSSSHSKQETINHVHN